MDRPTTSMPDATSPSGADYIRLAAIGVIQTLPDAALVEARDRLVEIFKRHCEKTVPSIRG